MSFGVTPLAPCLTATLPPAVGTTARRAPRACRSRLAAPDRGRRLARARRRVPPARRPLRRIAAQRDGHLTPPDQLITSDRDLVAFINTLNAGGVAYARAAQPARDHRPARGRRHQVRRRVCRPRSACAAIYPVSWAGEQASENWMDIGREYTEHWHHQMQIRDAVGRPRLLAPQWLLPLLDMSVRALPHAYAGVAAANGTAVTLGRHRRDDRRVVTCPRGRSLADSSRTAIGARRGSSRSPQTMCGGCSTTRCRQCAAVARDGGREDADLAAPLLRARSVMV